MSETETFYNDLADLYHLIYADWAASIERQGDALAGIIREHDASAQTVADVACGIGTQSMGLAARGFQVIASDVSPGAVARLKREARVPIDARIDDMLRLATYRDQSADVVIACDNAVPHLLSDDQIRTAFRQFHRVLRPGALLILSVRDYAAMPPTPLRFIDYGSKPVPGGKVSIFQIWEYAGDLYQFVMHFIFDYRGRMEIRKLHATYYAVSIDTLCRLAAEAGFHNVRRLDEVLFQPVIVATSSTVNG